MRYKKIIKRYNAGKIIKGNPAGFRYKANPQTEYKGRDLFRRHYSGATSPVKVATKYKLRRAFLCL